MTTETQTASSPNLAGKYLTVVLADESYGIAVLKVREIIRLQPITSVPQLPEHILGVISLRDRVIPIVDLRLKFGLDAQTDGRTCIVVVDTAASDHRAVPLGLVVDAVEDVVNLVAGDIAPPRSFDATPQPDYLLGMAKIRERVKALLNIDRALSMETLCRLETIS